MENEVEKAQKTSEDAMKQVQLSTERLKLARAASAEAMKAVDHATQRAKELESQNLAVTNCLSNNTYNPSWLANSSYGSVRDELICPQCSKKGMVHTKSVTKKVGISGGKATGALLTAGLSLFAFGLSRKESATQAHCANCQSTWHF